MNISWVIVQQSFNKRSVYSNKAVSLSYRAVRNSFIKTAKITAKQNPVQHHFRTPGGMPH